MNKRLRILTIFFVFLLVSSGIGGVVSFLLLSGSNPGKQILSPKISGNKDAISQSEFAITKDASSAAIPRLPYGINTSPYGVSLTGMADETVIRSYTRLGMKWVREKILWTEIETAPGVYDWAKLDDHVKLLNHSGIHMVFVIHNAPVWHRIICETDKKQFAFTADGAAGFAEILAKRYNGKNERGFIDGYEVGYGDFDIYKDEKNTEPCRSGSYYAPVLRKTYQAIKENSPKSLVGMSALISQSKLYERQFLEELFSTDPEIGKYFDYGAITYENTSPETKGDPAKQIPGNPDYPTFQEKLSIMRNVFVQHTLADKGIWVSSVGWKDSLFSLDIQTKYLTAILSQAQQSKVIHKVFIEETVSGILSKKLEKIKEYIAEYPAW